LKLAQTDSSQVTVSARQMLKQNLMKVFDEPMANAILDATEPTVFPEECGADQFDTRRSQDYKWCPGAIEYVKEQSGGQAKGLSYGIATYDDWAKGMGNDYNVPTEMYDCFDGKAELTDLKRNLQEFTGEYQFHNECVDSQKRVDDHGRRFDTMDQHLAGQEPLSTFVKMDIEGDEWKVLSDMTKKPEDLDKVATLDLQFHFCNGRADDADEVGGPAKLLKALSEKFEVAGRSDFKKGDEYCGVNPLKVSYVNKELMSNMRNE